MIDSTAYGVCNTPREVRNIPPREMLKIEMRSGYGPFVANFEKPCKQNHAFATLVLQKNWVARGMRPTPQKL